MSLLGEEQIGAVDAILLLSFGGPEGPEHVMSFLENVTRGRGIPRERLADVAEHYLHFGGVSPINGINRELIAQLRGVIDLPVYFGNRNWEPYVEDTVAAMRDNGIRRAAVFTTSAWGGYPAAHSTSKTSHGRGRRPARAPNWSNCVSTSIIRCSSRCSPKPSARRRRRARRRAAGVHRTFHSRCGPISLRPRPVQPPGGVCIAPRRHGGRL